MHEWLCICIVSSMCYVSSYCEIIFLWIVHFVLWTPCLKHLRVRWIGVLRGSFHPASVSFCIRHRKNGVMQIFACIPVSNMHDRKWWQKRHNILIAATNLDTLWEDRWCLIFVSVCILLLWQWQWQWQNCCYILTV